MSEIGVLTAHLLHMKSAYSPSYILDPIFPHPLSQIISTRAAYISCFTEFQMFCFALWQLAANMIRLDTAQVQPARNGKETRFPCCGHDHDEWKTAWSLFKPV